MKINKSEVTRAFGDTIRDLRKKKGLSQEDLCHLAEISRSFLSEIERGVKQPTISTLFVLAENLGVKAATIVSKVEKSLSS